MHEKCSTAMALPLVLNASLLSSEHTAGAENGLIC